MAKELAFDADTVQQIVKLRGEGRKWEEIGEAMNMAPGKAMLLHSSTTVDKKDVVKNPTPADIKRLRDDQNLSWGAIMVRTSLPESAVRSMYREAGGEDKGHRIGKGGRHPGGGSAEPRAPREPRAAKATKTAETAAPAEDILSSLEEAEIKEKLGGYAIQVDLGSGEKETIAVKEVKRAGKGKVVLVDAKTGATRTLKTVAIRKISARKVKV